MNDDFFFAGTVASIFFSNPSNFYKVVLLEIDDTNNTNFNDTEIVVTGTIGDLIEGESYTFWGQMTTHPKYGEQLTVVRYEKAHPTTQAGLIKFFTSDQFPGIGTKTAEKILSLYPDRTIDAILEAPEQLTEVLSRVKYNSFLKQLRENQGEDRLLVELAKYGLPNSVNLRLIETYHEETLTLVKTRPYELVEEIEGVGFTLADRIANQEGISANDPSRLRAGLLHTLVHFSHTTGDTYMFQGTLISAAQSLLEEARPVEITISQLTEALSALIEDEKVISLTDKVFEPSLFRAETHIATRLRALRNQKIKHFNDAQIKTAIAAAEKELSITYDSSQKEALRAALCAPLSLLTGGPGTGKTTIIQGLLQAYAFLHQVSLDTKSPLYKDQLFPIILAAPTGRAARRMNEVTDLPAATIHRHLGLLQDDNNEEEYCNELSGQLLIVDEFSMVDTWLAAKLLKAIPLGMQVVFVGDADQLPSVGPGQVFADLLSAQALVKTRLTTIYRQSDDSTIISLASTIKEGQLPLDLTLKQPDRSFFAADAMSVPFFISQIAQSWQKRGNDPFELQILAPMYKGFAGINHLNQLLQEIFNPKENRLEFAYKSLIFRPRDKVLHLVNNAEAGVFNGDLGMITELVEAKHSESKQDELIMNFDGQELIYPRSEWYKLTLAYAMSIHKSQGSEFQTVVLPLVTNFSRMLQRNLLYTAVTRAKQSLILLGETAAFQRAVATVSSHRKTGLLEQLKGESYVLVEPEMRVAESPTRYEVLDKKEYILTTKMIDTLSFDALIGLTAEDLKIFAPL